MGRILVLSAIFLLLLTSSSFATAAEDSVFNNGLKKRTVVGVIYFKKNQVQLSAEQKREVERIAALVVAQSSPEIIVRVEGFATKQDRLSDPFTTSFSRAKSVWHSMVQIDLLDKDNLYLTGFPSEQAVSVLEGERVEIALYENPFKKEPVIFSSR